ncbi:MAG: hypothetical protein M1827_007105 [Pycnora praestabilis]|nr:MAG: hypothetical protein M1827_007105 [Pycnora praestabilis]
MAPDRGCGSTGSANGVLPKYKSITGPEDGSSASNLQGEEAIEDAEDDGQQITNQRRRRSEARKYLAEHAEEGQNFTVRGVLVGLVIGVIICFSNMYFGLQTGWVSGMSMPAALIGFAFFKSIAKYIDYPFTPVENVLVQTVAGALGTMPLGCGFVGVIPALNYMLRSEENGPLVLGVGKLIIWSLGICFFGVVFAVPLRQEVIIREKLKFPSGTATALMIRVLHGNKGNAGMVEHDSRMDTLKHRHRGEPYTTIEAVPSGGPSAEDEPLPETYPEREEQNEEGLRMDYRSDWKSKIQLLVISFSFSAGYTVLSYFIPHLRKIPVFGLPLASNWLWTLNPSPAYVGQGIIMGHTTTLHMLLGAIAGWGILSPLAKNKGWAPGPVSDWATGSKGWIVWVSLAIMLADSVVSIGWLAARPLFLNGGRYATEFRERVRHSGWKSFLSTDQSRKGYTALDASEPSTSLIPRPACHRRSVGDRSLRESLELIKEDRDLPDVDAPAEYLVSNRVVIVGLIASIAFCIGAIHFTFGDLVPLYATIVAVLLALLLSVMGVRALGETDLNPVSGISKLTQLFFALIIPQSNKNSVIINLLAGAVSESGALQAGDMMQDLKTGHLVGAAPKAQFYGQLIGSFVGAFVSAGVYKLYTNVYEVPGELFQVPTGYVWIFTARLVTGQGLPEMAWQWALGAGILFAVTTGLRVAGQGKGWQSFIPGGIAVAVGEFC